MGLDQYCSAQIFNNNIKEFLNNNCIVNEGTLAYVNDDRRLAVLVQKNLEKLQKNLQTQIIMDRRANREFYVQKKDYFDKSAEENFYDNANDLLQRAQQYCLNQTSQTSLGKEQIQNPKKRVHFGYPSNKITYQLQQSQNKMKKYLAFFDSIDFQKNPKLSHSRFSEEQKQLYQYNYDLTNFITSLDSILDKITEGELNSAILAQQVNMYTMKNDRIVSQQNLDINPVILGVKYFYSRLLQQTKYHSLDEFAYSENSLPKITYINLSNEITKEDIKFIQDFKNLQYIQFLSVEKQEIKESIEKIIEETQIKLQEIDEEQTMDQNQVYIDFYLKIDKIFNFSQKVQNDDLEDYETQSDNLKENNTQNIDLFYNFNLQMQQNKSQNSIIYPIKPYYMLIKYYIEKKQINLDFLEQNYADVQFEQIEQIKKIFNICQDIKINRLSSGKFHYIFVKMIQRIINRFSPDVILLSYNFTLMSAKEQSYYFPHKNITNQSQQFTINKKKLMQIFKDCAISANQKIVFVPQFNYQRKNEQIQIMKDDLSLLEPYVSEIFMGFIHVCQSNFTDHIDSFYNFSNEFISKLKLSDIKQFLNVHNLTQKLIGSHINKNVQQLVIKNFNDKKASNVPNFRNNEVLKQYKKQYKFNENKSKQDMEIEDNDQNYDKDLQTNQIIRNFIRSQENFPPLKYIYLLVNNELKAKSYELKVGSENVIINNFSQYVVNYKCKKLLLLNGSYENRKSQQVLENFIFDLENIENQDIIYGKVIQLDFGLNEGQFITNFNLVQIDKLYQNQEKKESIFCVALIWGNLFDKEQYKTYKQNYFPDLSKNIYLFWMDCENLANQNQNPLIKLKVNAEFQKEEVMLYRLFSGGCYIENNSIGTGSQIYLFSGLQYQARNLNNKIYKIQNQVQILHLSNSPLESQYNQVQNISIVKSEILPKQYQNREEQQGIKEFFNQQCIPLEINNQNGTKKQFILLTGGTQKSNINQQLDRQQIPLLFDVSQQKATLLKDFFISGNKELETPNQYLNISQNLNIYYDFQKLNERRTDTQINKDHLSSIVFINNNIKNNQKLKIVQDPRFLQHIDELIKLQKIIETKKQKTFKPEDFQSGNHSTQENIRNTFNQNNQNFATNHHSQQTQLNQTPQNNQNQTPQQTTIDQQTKIIQNIVNDDKSINLEILIDQQEAAVNFIQQDIKIKKIHGFDAFHEYPEQISTVSFSFLKYDPKPQNENKFLDSLKFPLLLDQHNYNFREKLQFKEYYHEEKNVTSKKMIVYFNPQEKAFKTTVYEKQEGNQQLQIENQQILEKNGLDLRTFEQTGQQITNQLDYNNKPVNQNQDIQILGVYYISQNKNQVLIITKEKKEKQLIIINAYIFNIENLTKQNSLKLSQPTYQIYQYQNESIYQKTIPIINGVYITDENKGIIIEYDQKNKIQQDLNLVQQIKYLGGFYNNDTKRIQQAIQTINNSEKNKFSKQNIIFKQKNPRVQFTLLMNQLEPETKNEEFISLYSKQYMTIEMLKEINVFQAQGLIVNNSENTGFQLNKPLNILHLFLGFRYFQNNDNENEDNQREKLLKIVKQQGIVFPLQYLSLTFNENQCPHFQEEIFSNFLFNSDIFPNLLAIELNNISLNATVINSTLINPKNQQTIYALKIKGKIEGKINEQKLMESPQIQQHAIIQIEKIQQQQKQIENQNNIQYKQNAILNQQSQVEFIPKYIQGCKSLDDLKFNIVKSDVFIPDPYLFQFNKHVFMMNKKIKITDEIQTIPLQKFIDTSSLQVLVGSSDQIQDQNKYITQNFEIKLDPINAQEFDILLHKENFNNNIQFDLSLIQALDQQSVKPIQYLEGHIIGSSIKKVEEEDLENYQIQIQICVLINIFEKYYIFQYKLILNDQPYFQMQQNNMFENEIITAKIVQVKDLKLNTNDGQFMKMIQYINQNSQSECLIFKIGDNIVNYKIFYE